MVAPDRAGPAGLAPGAIGAYPRAHSNTYRISGDGHVGTGVGHRWSVGERVRWYLMSSTNFEVHSAHWHGNTVVIDGKREDVTGLIGMERIVADMVPDNPGTWTFHCHVKEHVMAGMSSLYRVLPAER